MEQKTHDDLLHYGRGSAGIAWLILESSRNRARYTGYPTLGTSTRCLASAGLDGSLSATWTQLLRQGTDLASGRRLSRQAKLESWLDEVPPAP